MGSKESDDNEPLTVQLSVNNTQILGSLWGAVTPVQGYQLAFVSSYYIVGILDCLLHLFQVFTPLPEFRS